MVRIIFRLSLRVNRSTGLRGATKGNTLLKKGGQPAQVKHLVKDLSQVAPTTISIQMTSDSRHSVASISNTNDRR